MDLEVYERATAIQAQINGLKATLDNLINGGTILIKYQEYTSDLTNIGEIKYEVIEAIKRKINCLTSDFESL